MSAKIRDQLDDEILKAVIKNPGIRLAQLSSTVNRDIMTVRYRILALSLDGELTIEHGHRSLKIYLNKTGVNTGEVGQDGGS